MNAVILTIRIRRLADALDRAAGEVREMGCTCSDLETQNRVHSGRRAGDCTGDSQARRYEAIATRARRGVG